MFFKVCGCVFGSAVGSLCATWPLITHPGAYSARCGALASMDAAPASSDLGRSGPGHMQLGGMQQAVTRLCRLFGGLWSGETAGAGQLARRPAAR